jgi:hypothetical protein
MRLAGRADDGTQLAAAARIDELAPFAPQIREHLRAIVESRAFQNSRRAPAFLRYVVDNALDGDYAALKERCIGAELFDRKPDYDTNGDAIVRVTANDVRKRLLQFYHDLNEPSEFCIELPAGSYLPEIRRTPPPTPAGPPLAPDAVPPQSPSRRRFRRLSRREWACLTAGAACGLLVWAAAVHTGAGGRERREARLYEELLGTLANDSTQPTLLVFSNPEVLMHFGLPGNVAPREAPGRAVSVPAEVQRWLTPFEGEQEAAQPRHFLSVPGFDYTGMGEAIAAARVASVFSRLNRQPAITQARFLNWDVAQREHLIILGSPRMNGWIQTALQGHDYVMEHARIVNVRPRAGEPAAYPRGPQGKAYVDYGLIEMETLPSGSRVLLLAGLTSAGTAGVGNFFADAAKMERVRERLRAEAHGGALPGSWQALLRIVTQDDVPQESSLIALRPHRN